MNPAMMTLNVNSRLLASLDTDLGPMNVRQKNLKKSWNELIMHVKKIKPGADSLECITARLSYKIYFVSAPRDAMDQFAFFRLVDLLSQIQNVHLDRI